LAAGFFMEYESNENDDAQNHSPNC
jgi:hypothetical protein